MEYCDGGSVSELAKAIIVGGHHLSENVIKYILHQALNGIFFLHSNRVIHRDIKGPNILMTRNGEVKLIDCGVSAVLANTLSRRHSSVGSPFWMAPEVIACEQQLDYQYDNRCDIWSLGITAIELADGEPPMAELHPMNALFKIPRNPPPTVRNPTLWSNIFIKFIARAVTKDFEIRPDAALLLSDEFFLKCVDQLYLSKCRMELMSLIHIITKQFKVTGIPLNARTLQARMENARKNRQYLEVDDLASLPKLTNEIILSYIQERFAADHIYTYIGDILIAVNPLKDIPIYGPGASLLYQNGQKDSLPPHIFMVACSAYQSLIHKHIDQCCVISGESGSGKTVSANFLIQQLAWIGKVGGAKDKINHSLVKKILQINPLMEAFANAQTVINHNSSRFGKFLELHFTHSGALVGAQLSEYLLEKSRVVSQPRGERNFHMLYYVIAGLDYHNKLDKFELNTLNKHRYLNTDELSLSEYSCTSEMQDKFIQLQQSLEVLGFTAEEIQSLYCIIAGIIHIGDLEFMVDDLFSYEGEKAKIVNFKTLETVASLLCVEKNDLSEAMVTYSSVTRGETIIRNNTVEQAFDCRDAMAKALYGRLVSWIVKKVNALLRAEDRTNTVNTKIGILDIFGFENFAQNSFEQLCINIANEQLQFYFNEHIFVWEQEEYKSEGLKSFDIEFINNKPILDLFLQKPVGVLALLDEESRFPKASDLTLVEKFQDNISSEYMILSKETNTFFTIKHFADKVTYDATGFLEKNRDTLSMDVVQTLRLSSDKTLAALFLGSDLKQDTKMSGNSSHSSQSATISRLQQTVSVQFRQSLRMLLSKIIKSEPHFVRCLRPNLQNNPNIFDAEKVMKQLKYTGVLETAKIRQKGFSERILFKDFVQRYKFIFTEFTKPLAPTPANCLIILRESKIDENEQWQIGKTKVFLKYWHVEKLNSIVDINYTKIKICQKVARSFIFRRRFKKEMAARHKAATKIRAVWLGYKQRKLYLKSKIKVAPEVTEMAILHSKKKKTVAMTSTTSLLKRETDQKVLPQKSVNHRQSVTHHALLQKNVENSDIKQISKISAKDVLGKSGSDSKWERLRNYIHQKAIVKNNGSTDAVRPYYRNIKREKRGYEDYEDFYSSDDEDTTKKIAESDNFAYITNPPVYQRISDPEGQAALEETRAIILLSQIDLASKEALELLNRTCYPVIHSVREKAQREGHQKLKSQKLDHKDRMIAVVEGFGDPLRQKYRQARLHLAEEVEGVVQEDYKNAPMLGLVEKPKKREEIKEETIPQKRAQKKPANRNPRKHLPPNKAAINEDYYPRRQQRTTPKTKSEWFFPRGNDIKVERNFETKLVKEEISANKKYVAAQENKTPETEKFLSYRDRVLESRREYLSRNDHKPFNYLNNDQRTLRKKISTFDSPNVEDRPSKNSDFVNSRQYVTPSNPFFVPDYASGVALSNVKEISRKTPIEVPIVHSNMTPKQKYADNYFKNISDNYLYSNFDKRSDSKINPYQREQRKNINISSPLYRNSSPMLDNYENYLKDDYEESPRDLKPMPLPGLVQRPIDFNNISKLNRFVSPPDDVVFERPRTKRPNGFNYGFEKDSVLQDLKLKKTGRLQDLLERRN
ncbi:myosin-IIIb isoform X11 [Hydra vulgaris]